MTVISEKKKNLDFSTLIEFSRAGLALNAEVLQNYLDNGSLPIPKTLDELLDIPNLAIPSIFAKPTGNDLLTDQAFIFCDPETPIILTEEDCKKCRKNPTAFTEDWTQQSSGYVFFNGKDCTVNAVVDTGIFTMIQSEMIDVYLSNGITTLLRNYNKSQTMTVVSYKPKIVSTTAEEIGRQALSSLIPKGFLSSLIGAKLGDTMVGPGLPQPKVGFERILQEFDTIEQLLPLAQRTFQPSKSIYVPGMAGITTKILVTIPVESFNKVPEIMQSEPKILSASQYDAPIEVRISGKDYKSKIFRNVGVNVKRAGKYGEYEQGKGKRFYDKDSNIFAISTFDPNNPDSSKQIAVPKNINFIQAGDALAQFDRDYVDPVLKRLGIKKNNLEFISFFVEFTSPSYPKDGLRFKEITIKKFGCEPVDLVAGGIYKENSAVDGVMRGGFYINIVDPVSRLVEFNDNVVLGYVAQLPDMDYYLKGKRDVDWIDFLCNYTYPGLVIKDPNSLLEQNSAFEDFRCLANKSASNILNSLIEKGLVNLDLLNGAIKNFVCSKLEDYREEYNTTVDMRKRLEIILSQPDNANLKILLERLGLDSSNFGALTTQGGTTGIATRGIITGGDAISFQNNIQSLYDKLMSIKKENGVYLQEREKIRQGIEKRFAQENIVGTLGDRNLAGLTTEEIERLRSQPYSAKYTLRDNIAGRPQETAIGATNLDLNRISASTRGSSDNELRGSLTGPPSNGSLPVSTAPESINAEQLRQEQIRAAQERNNIIEVLKDPDLQFTKDGLDAAKAREFQKAVDDYLLRNETKTLGSFTQGSKSNEQDQLKVAMYEAHHGNITTIDYAMELLAELTSFIQKSQSEEKLKKIEEIRGLKEIRREIISVNQALGSGYQGKIPNSRAENADRKILNQQAFDQFVEANNLQRLNLTRDFKTAWKAKSNEIKSFLDQKPLVKILLEAIAPAKTSGKSILGITKPNKGEGTLADMMSGFQKVGGWCGWVKLILEASQCIIKGLDVPDFKAAIIKSALKNITPWQFQKVFRNFPADARTRIVDVLRKQVPNLICGLFPWECDYGSTKQYNSAKNPRGIFQEPADPKFKEWEDPEIPQLPPIPRINFDFDKDILRDEDKKELDSWWAYVTSTGAVDENFVLSVVGHTDTKGSNTYNVDLSKRRAYVVRDYFIKTLGYNGAMSVSWVGETKPIVNTGNEVANFENRRTELFVASKEGSQPTAEQQALIEAYTAQKEASDLAASGNTSATSGTPTNATETKAQREARLKAEAEKKADLAKAVKNAETRAKEATLAFMKQFYPDLSSKNASTKDQYKYFYDSNYARFLQAEKEKAGLAQNPDAYNTNPPELNRFGPTNSSIADIASSAAQYDEEAWSSTFGTYDFGNLATNKDPEVLERMRLIYGDEALRIEGSIGSLSAFMNADKLFDSRYKELEEQIKKERQETEKRARIAEKQREMQLNALGKQTSEAFATIINELTDVLVDTMIDVVGVDTLFEVIQDVPGYNIVSKFIKTYSCIIPEKPLFDPPLNEFLKTLRFDLCHIGQEGWIDMTLPKYNNLFPGSKKLFGDIKVGLKNLFKLLAVKARDFLLDLAVQLLIKLVTTVIEALLDFMCTMAGNAAGMIQDAITGNKTVKNTLKNALCPNENLSDDQFSNGLINIASAIFSDTTADSDCTASLSPREMAGFLDGILVSLSYGQIYDLLLGNPSDTTLTIASTIAKNSDSKCIRQLFGDPGKLANYFKGLGLLVDAQKILSAFPNNVLLTDYASVCPPNSMDALNKFRSALLRDKGLTPQEVNEQLELLKNQAAKKLEDLANALSKGPFADLPPIIGDGSCPPSAVILSDPSMELANSIMAETIFAPIEKRMLTDLSGERGVIGRILSDTNGRPIKNHRIIRSFLGNQYGYENTGLEFYSDDAIRRSFATEDGQLRIGKLSDRIDSSGRKYDFGDTATVVGPQGGYPPTVAAHLMVKLQSMKIGLIDKQNMSWEIKDFYNTGAPENTKFTYPTFKTRRLDLKDMRLKEVANLRNRAIAFYRKERVAMWAIATGFVSAEYASKYIKTYTIDPATKEATKNRLDYERIIIFEQMISACSRNIFDEYIDSFPNASPEKRVNRILGQPKNPELREINHRGKIIGLSYIIKEKIEKIINTVGLNSFININSIPYTYQMMLFYLLSWYSHDETSRYYTPFLPPNPRSEASSIFGFTYKTKDTDSNSKPNIPFEKVPFVNPYELGLSYVSYPKAIGMSNTNKSLTKPEYSFDLTYDMNLEDEKKGILLENKKYKYRVLLTENFNPFMDERLEGSPETSRAHREALKEAAKSGIGNNNPDSSVEESEQAPIVSTSGEVIKFIGEISSVPTIEIKQFADDLLSDVDPLDLDYSYEAEAFLRFIRYRMVNTTTQIDLPLIDSILNRPDAKLPFKNIFDRINTGLIRRISKRIGEGNAENKYYEYDDSEESPREVIVPKAFSFGYDTDITPQVVVLDPATYGGSEESPPFYVKPPEYGGWMGILQSVIPEDDACEPKRTPLYSLSDIKKKIPQLSREIIPDERLNFDPICTKESPFDSIYDSNTLASMDALISATARTYILDIALRIMPVLTEFSLDPDNNFDDLLTTYISEYALEIMKTVDKKRLAKLVGRKVETNLGENPKFIITQEKEVRLSYYYGFLEQVYNIVQKKLASEIIPRESLTISEQESLDAIAAKVSQYYNDYAGTEAVLSDEAIQAQDMFKRALNPTIVNQLTPSGNTGTGPVNFDKLRAKKIKRSLSYAVVREMENEAKVIFNIYIKEEFRKLKKSFDSKFKPNVQKLNYLLVSSEQFVNGAVKTSYDELTGDPIYSQPYDVMEDPRDSSKFNIDLTKFTNLIGTVNSDPKTARIQSILTNNKLNDVADEFGRKWPFVLEKYIAIDEKLIENIDPKYSSIISKIQNRPNNLKGVVNMNSFKAYLEQLIAQDPKADQLLSTLFGQGIVDEADARDGRANNSGLRFGVRLSLYFDLDDPEVEPLANLINKLSLDSVIANKAYRVNSSQGRGILIPVANGELPIADNYISSFSLDEFDLICTLNELIKSNDFNFINQFLFPSKRYLSLMSIYIANSFFDAIGNIGRPSEGGDRWTIPGGKKLSGFRRWDKESAFFDPGMPGPDTANTLMSSFLALYATKNKFRSPDNRSKKNSDKTLKDLLVNLIPEEIFKDIPSWKKRNQVPRPYDAVDNECFDMDEEDDE